MNVEDLDLLVARYLSELKRNKTIRNLSNVTYKINKSRRSNSVYLLLTININNVNYNKRIRFSNHDRPKYVPPYSIKQDVRIGEGKNTGDKLTKREIKYVKSVIRRELKKLIYGAGIHAIRDFKADP